MSKVSIAWAKEETARPLSQSPVPPHSSDYLATLHCVKGPVHTAPTTFFCGRDYDGAYFRA